MLMFTSIHFLVIASILLPLFTHFKVNSRVAEIIFSILAVGSFVKLSGPYYEPFLYMCAFAAMYACILFSQKDKKIKQGWEVTLFSGVISMIVAFLLGLIMFKIVAVVKGISSESVYHTHYTIGAFSIPKAACIYVYVMTMRLLATMCASIAYKSWFFEKNKNK